MSEYSIPKGLQQKSDIFIFSFANRTKKNLEFIERAAEKERIEGKSINEVSVFEVTQLINSLIGLVTFPKEKFYKKVVDCGNGQYASTRLRMLVIDITRNPKKYNYKNTYLQQKGKKTYSKYETETLNVMAFIRHFRNALSHDKLSVYPDSVGNDQEIKGFVFEDECKISVIEKEDRYTLTRDSDMLAVPYKQKFKVRLTVEEIRDVAYDICDMLLTVGREVYRIDEKIDELY